MRVGRIGDAAEEENGVHVPVSLYEDRICRNRTERGDQVGHIGTGLHRHFMIAVVVLLGAGQRFVPVGGAPRVAGRREDIHGSRSLGCVGGGIKAPPGAGIAVAGPLGRESGRFTCRWQAEE